LKRCFYINYFLLNGGINCRMNVFTLVTNVCFTVKTHLLKIDVALTKFRKCRNI
jgi:hypothetical protein